MILIAIRNDLADKVQFRWPAPYHRIMTLRDAFFKGALYDSDVPASAGQKYPANKQKVMELVPMGGILARLAPRRAERIHGRQL